MTLIWYNFLSIFCYVYKVFEKKQLYYFLKEDKEMILLGKKKIFLGLIRKE